MIAKTFSTITLRGLEDKPELVKIMNQVMQDKGINTGQAVIETIIKDYANKSEKLQSTEFALSALREKHQRLMKEKEEEIKEIESHLKSFQEAFGTIVKLSKMKLP